MEPAQLTQAKVENRFNKDDKVTLKNFGLPQPSELKEMTDAQLRAIKKESIDQKNDISQKIGGLKKHIGSLEKKKISIPKNDKDDLESLTNAKETLLT